MNCNDRLDERCLGCQDEKRLSITIPLHKLVNWYRDWRNRKTKLEIDHIQEYEEVVRDYLQDQ